MKAIAWIIGIVVLLVVGGIAFVALNSGSLIKTVIEEVGPEYLGAQVGVGGVDLSLTEGSAQVSDLRIGNPAGFDGPDAMRVGEVKVALDTSQMDNPQKIVMKEILIDGAEIAAVAKGQRTNFQQIMDNLEQSSGGSDSAASDTSSAPETKFIVDKFSFTNAKASVVSDVLGELDLDIPDIHLNGIGRKSDGATAAELAEEILKPISAAISKAAVSQGLDIEGAKEQALQKAKDKIDEKLGGALKGLLD